MERSRSIDEVLGELREIAARDGEWGFGRAFTYVFDGPDLSDLTVEAMRLFSGSNGLDPTAFPSFLRFENDLMAFARSILNGDEQAVGSATSGGTESIILATKAARDSLRAGGVEGRLNVVLPITGHAAFHKAAAYLDLDIRPTAVDEGFRAIPEAVDEAIDERTALVVASAPSYAHGVVDPIAEIGRVAKKTGRWLHVDACVGGMVLPFLDDAPDFDFSIETVDSISMDLHKYGYTPKGASLVLYRDAERRSHQFFATASWTGYPVANPTIQSTRSGASLAAAWAAVLRLCRGAAEKKQALAAMAAYPLPETLRAAAGMLNDPAVRAEARAAVKRMIAGLQSGAAGAAPIPKEKLDKMTDAQLKAAAEQLAKRLSSGPEKSAER